MKSGKDRPGWAVIVTLLAAAVFVAVAFLLLTGCASSKPVAGPEREIIYVGIEKPIPPPELEGISWDELLAQFQIRTLSREAIEADGSVLIQALTHDFLIVLDECRKAFTQRDASNAGRQVVIDAQAEAEAELERLRNQ